MNRRGFLGAILAAAAAPAVVRAGVLMPIYVPAPPHILRLWGDGIHDDRAAMQALFDGGPVFAPDGRILERLSNQVAIPAGTFLMAGGGVVASGVACIFSSGTQLVAGPRFDGAMLTIKGWR